MGKYDITAGAVNTVTENIYQAIKKSNSGYIRHIVLFILVTISGIFSSLEIRNPDDHDLFLNMLSFYYVGMSCFQAVLLGVIIPYEYLRKYLNIVPENKNTGFLLKVVNLDGRFPLESYARYYSFDINNYFKLLKKRYLCPYILTIFLFIGEFAFCKKSEIIIGLLLCIILIPLTFIYLKNKIKRYTTAETDPLENFLRGFFGDGIIGLISLLTVTIIAMLSFVFGYVIIHGVLLKIPVDDRTPAFICSNGEALPVNAVIAGIILMFTLLQNKKIYFHKINLRVVGICLSILILSPTLIISMQKNITVMEESFIIKNWGKSYEYGLDDVSAFVIFDEHDDINMKLTFSDNRSINIFSGIMIETDAWSEKYYGNASFVLYLTKELNTMGISGEFSENDKKSLTMSYKENDYDRQLKEDLKQICDIMENR